MNPKSDINDNDKVDKEEHEVSYDDLLSSAGELGRYQWLLFFSSCPFFAFGVCVYFSQMFMTEVSSNHWCWIPELANLTDIQRRNIGVPRDENARYGYSQCEMYAVNWTDALATGQTPNQTWKTVPCRYGWEFNRSEIPYPTVGSDFEWVCEKKSYQATAQAMFFVGSIFGGFTFGWIADRFGRLPAVIGSCFVGSLGGFTSTFARNVVEFTATRFVMGMSYDTCMIMAYLLILEYIGPKHRTLIANMACAVFYSLFVTALPWIALACGHWKTISLVTSLPLAIGILSRLFIPESPMWLLSKRRVEEAVEKVQVIGRINGKVIPQELINKFKQSVSNSKKDENPSLLAILRRPVLRKLFILICLEYTCCILVFDGLVRTIGQLEYDFFVSFSVISFTEFPSVLLVAFIMDYIGRKWLTIVLMALSSVSCLLVIFSSGIQTVVFAFIARFGVNVGLTAILQWGPEVLPTSVRGSGVAVMHVCGYLASFLSPYVAYSEVYYTWLPLVVIGAVAALAMLIPIALPETAMKGMPQTFEDAEDLTKNQRIWTLPFLEARKVKTIMLRKNKKNHVAKLNFEA